MWVHRCTRTKRALAAAARGRRQSGRPRREGRRQPAARDLHDCHPSQRPAQPPLRTMARPSGRRALQAESTGEVPGARTPWVPQRGEEGAVEWLRPEPGTLHHGRLACWALAFALLPFPPSYILQAAI